MRRIYKTCLGSIVALLLAPYPALATHTGTGVLLKFSAPPATVCEGSSFTLQLIMDAPSEGINAAQVDLTFDPAAVRVDSMNWLTSMFRFFAEGPEWDNGAGTIHMIGGLPTPGFQGMNGLVAEVSMTTTGGGNPNLLYNAATTDVLLDDGFGTSTLVEFDNAIIDVLPSTHPSCTAPVTCSNRTILEGGTANLTAAGGDGSYIWTTTGGTPSSGAGSALSVTYATAGSYPVSVIDAGGKVGNCTVSVGVPPFGCSPNSRSIIPGGTAAFSAVGGTGPYDWTTTGGTPTGDTGDAFSATYADLGTYTVTMTDALGASDTCQVNVNPPAPTPTPCPVCDGGRPDMPPLEAGTTETEARNALETVLSNDVANAVADVVYGNTDIIAMVATATAVGTALATALAILQMALAAGGVAQATGLLLQSLFAPGKPDKRNRRLWGTVYDSVTKFPVAGARVEILGKDKRVLESRFTDRDGRYGFVISTESIKSDVREVQIVVNKKAYRFPGTHSDDENEKMIYHNIYRGGIIKIRDDQLVSHDIPIDPEVPPEFEQKKVPLGVQFSRWIASFAEASFKVGIVMAPLNFLLHPSLFDGVVVGIYGVVGIARLLGANFRPYGLIVDSTSSNAVPYSFITLSDAANRRVGQAVSDDRGRYFLLSEKGAYIIEAHTPAQIQPPRMVRHAVKAKKGWVSRKLTL